MLPDVGFGIDYAHVGLVGSAIDEYSVVHLQKGVLRVVLASESVSRRRAIGVGDSRENVSR